MAKTYLDSNDVYTLATSNTTIYGGTGNERVVMQSGVTGTTLDQNIEQVDLSGAKSSYNYQQSGNQLKVYSGSTLVATIPVQEDGTSLQFTDEFPNVPSSRLLEDSRTVNDADCDSVIVIH